MRFPIGRARRWTRSTIDYLRYVYGSEWKYVVGLLGVVLGFIVSVLPATLVVVVTAVGTVLTLVLLLLDTRDLRSRWAGARLFPNVDELNTYPFSCAAWQANDDAGLERSGIVELANFSHRSRGERVWLDAGVNAAIGQLALDAPITVDPQQFVLPGDLREIAPQALRRTANPSASVDERTDRPLWFNGRIARLMTEPTLDALADGPLRFQRVSYFDGQASNELWHWTRDGSLPERPRIPLLHAVDVRERILSLERSSMANMVGVSLLAITADDRVLFVAQSSRNSVAPGGFAASASGSLDWADVLACGRAARHRARDGGQTASATASATVSPGEAPATEHGAARRVSAARRAAGSSATLHDVLAAGMLRELEEESQVGAADVVPGSVRMTGYFRWLSRGAKPEFTGIARVNATAEELIARSPSSTERLYTAGHASVPASLLLEPRPGAGIDRWQAPLDALIDALYADLPRPAAGPLLSASTIATWHAAADYVEARPEWLRR